MDGWTKQPCFIHRAGISFSHKNEKKKKSSPFVTTWTDLEGIRLSETEKDKHYTEMWHLNKHTPNS